MFQTVSAIYDKELRETALKEQGIISQFHDALEGGQFCFYIQPQISADGVVRGGEALVRWIHPERGMIPPGEFIELFERTGLISELDRYIWEKACIQLRDWCRQGHADFLFVSQTFHHVIFIIWISIKCLLNWYKSMASKRRIFIWKSRKRQSCRIRKK